MQTFLLTDILHLTLPTFMETCIPTQNVEQTNLLLQAGVALALTPQEKAAIATYLATSVATTASTTAITTTTDATSTITTTTTGLA
ncbi:hypothetical protein L5515_006957 [Caenorhabditis briggsae]|uniref:Uncharacterized protein n=1 Tax=Caenorhabditis briggsae TaxID=6238 RepID=A0AAE9F1U1_CAEBR|nr:hypothetical protein L5515_006954 [Caenorhabditis briggsae]UMM33496.1 hypothetical protein L5515_006957 [Caenorhabditis briggsae]